MSLSQTVSGWHRVGLFSLKMDHACWHAFGQSADRKRSQLLIASKVRPFLVFNYHTALSTSEARNICLYSFHGFYSFK